MGRYYNGDINGKFWFGVQSSYAPERFGTMPMLSFSFSEDDIPSVKEEIKNIEENLGEWKEKIEEFFKNNNGYNEDMLIEAGFPPKEIHYLLAEYADLELGRKILACIEEKRVCAFEAEL